MLTPGHCQLPSHDDGVCSLPMTLPPSLLPTPSCSSCPSPQTHYIPYLLSLQSLKRSRFQKACSFGRRVYRWTTYTYSAVQVYQNPWLMRALLTALWATSRVSMRFLL